MAIPAFHSNLFSIATGLNPWQLKKGFSLQSGLGGNYYRFFRFVLGFNKIKINTP
jgi:hypothetical protein